MSAQGPAVPNAPDEPVEPKIIQWATLDAIREAIKAKASHPTHVHTDEETGLSFEFRELTGKDMDRIADWSNGDEEKYGQIMIETASVKPKIDMLMWEGLGELGPLVRVGILQFVRKTSRLSFEAKDEVKNS